MYIIYIYMCVCVCVCVCAHVCVYMLARPPAARHRFRRGANETKLCARGRLFIWFMRDYLVRVNVNDLFEREREHDVEKEVRVKYIYIYKSISKYIYK